jgi:3-dehydroquinate dehydratase/shikimate dehydrogenase
MTEIVETVTGASTEALRAARDQASADLVELRLDGVASVDVAGALEGRRTPVIVTCRPTWEGGRFDGSEDERFRILNDAIRHGAEYVDVEWKADRKGLVPLGRTALVLSTHDFDGLPADLDDRIRAMRREPAAIVKVAVMPARLADCLTLRRAMQAPPGRQIAIAMGPRGQITRLCPWLFESAWTYGGTAAPGQVAARDLADLYRVRTGTTKTTVYGITGNPLGHSASPAMHNPGLAAAGLDAIYVPFETDDADDFLTVAEALGVAGASVTAPHKPAIFKRTATTDALSRRVGALNTLRRTSSGWEGRNFDAAGFLAPLDRRGVALSGIRAVVLGAGGAARTTAWALHDRGARVELTARRAERAAALATELGVETTAWPPAPGWDLLVNTTPVGTWPEVDASPIEAGRVRGRLIYDLIYNPRETRLLREARAAGSETIDGLEMLVSQACLQFEWWTGIPAPRDAFMDAADSFVRHRQRQTS